MERGRDRQGGRMRAGGDAAPAGPVGRVKVDGGDAAAIDQRERWTTQTILIAALLGILAVAIMIGALLLILQNVYQVTAT